MVKFMLRPLLEKISLFLMQTESDKERMISLGADPSRVMVSGNMKFDSAVSADLGKEEKRKISSLLGLREKERLLVAGSTHPGEEEIIISAYINLKRGFKDLRLLIAPRHIERAAEIESLVSVRGLKPVKISELSASRSQLSADCIFILDTIGQLKSFYSIASIVFIGGSLIRKGGQNMIEPAAFARPILFGPYTFNFQDITSIFLKEEAAMMVKDAQDLERAAYRILKDRGLSVELGDKARTVVEDNRGASDLTLASIDKLCRKRL
jgi:3-deoxy-D-manno-octulosonic-acid transferase